MSVKIFWKKMQIRWRLWGREASKTLCALGGGALTSAVLLYVVIKTDSSASLRSIAGNDFLMFFVLLPSLFGIAYVFSWRTAKVLSKAEVFLTAWSTLCFFVFYAEPLFYFFTSAESSSPLYVFITSGLAYAFVFGGAGFLFALLLPFNIQATSGRYFAIAVFMFVVNMCVSVALFVYNPSYSLFPLVLTTANLLYVMATVKMNAATISSSSSQYREYTIGATLVTIFMASSAFVFDIQPVVALGACLSYVLFANQSITRLF